MRFEGSERQRREDTDWLPGHKQADRLVKFR